MRTEDDPTRWYIEALDSEIMDRGIYTVVPTIPLPLGTPTRSIQPIKSCGGNTMADIERHTISDVSPLYANASIVSL